MKPRILIFSIAYEPLVGGAELAVRNITDRLSNLGGRDGSSYDFDLITARFNQSHKSFERVGNVNVYRVGFGSRIGRYLYPAFAYRLARKMHKKEPYALVWSIMAAYAGAAALMFLRRFPAVKFLLTLQEGDSVEHIHRRVRGFEKIWRRVFRRADRIQAISKYLADWATAEGATSLIVVIPNGVDLTKFKVPAHKMGEARPKIFGRQNSRVNIITTSRLVEKNGIDILIEASAILKSQAPDLKFRIQIVGGGQEEARLKKLTRQLQVEDVVEFVGEVEPRQIPEYLAAADVFVRPSRSEGLGISFLEAMAAGLPVIGPPVGGIPEFLKDGETGLFCEIENPESVAAKIKILADSPGLREQLGRQGKNLVANNYNWDKIAESMDQVFKTLIPAP